MKRGYLLLGIAPLLFSCGSNINAKAVDSANDFIEVAAASELKISFVSSNVGAVTGGTDPMAGVTARAYYYSNDNYRIETATDNHIGYTLVTAAGLNQYCLINTKTKNGTIYANADSLNEERALTVAELERQYNALGEAYQMMKNSFGKSAQELGYTSYEFRRSIAPDVAGYVLLTEKVNGEEKVVTNYYLMMDKIGGKWAFTNYSVRSTVYKMDNGAFAVDHYETTQYQITVVEEYPAIPISLSGYALTVVGLDVADVQYDSDGPLSGR